MKNHKRRTVEEVAQVFEDAGWTRQKHPGGGVLLTKPEDLKAKEIARRILQEEKI